MKADFFLNNPDLYDPKAGLAAERVRKHIFERARAPIREHDEENKKLREHQADSFFMPRLGGSDGDLPETTREWKDNGRNRYASMTQLQYDRLAKWANGQFKTGDPEVIYESFDVIPLKDQPEALTRAALEWSVGVPLYPGIEVYWGAELENKYNLGAKYRFSDDVKPGDLGKGLALPWQSDFFMCNTHWWPSIRPDNIVTEEFFTNTANHFQNNKSIIALNLTERVRWDRGLERDPYDSDDSDEDSFDIKGTSDMVRKWSKLGFITQEQAGSGDFPFPVYVEKERHPNF
ncbi:hypothetical protein RSOLAG1IB_07413 [Rhizoctonia solani AG-1 IB]|uniref:L-lysine epsilon oxidase C-terminal domain-containing protein n=1 Tax=Thanatephorus cucumeris (strain AG1-IB / isolate 7/3/14) TaxID=1108050 RepID=A0A0B7FA23_THACB|nr:hypothetical protein RSOLAG1IB_07413 [Rhizoctonia solani AG-1 IB]